MHRLSTKVTRLGYSNYDAYLQSAHWTEFKKRYRKSGRQCVCAVCGDAHIVFHHHNYERLGAESLDDITPLCPAHHDQVHAWLLNEKRPVAATAEAVAAIRGGEVVDLTQLIAYRLKKKTRREGQKTASTQPNSQKKLSKGARRKLRKLKRKAEQAANAAKRIEASREAARTAKVVTVSKPPPIRKTPVLRSQEEIDRLEYEKARRLKNRAAKRAKAAAKRATVARREMAKQERLIAAQVRNKKLSDADNLTDAERAMRMIAAGFNRPFRKG